MAAESSSGQQRAAREAADREPASQSSAQGPRDLGVLVRELEEALGEKLREVRRQEQKVDNERRALADEKVAMAVLGAVNDRPPGAGDVLKLNVGGRIFATRRCTLTQIEGSVLEGMFSGRWDRSFDMDDEGRVFLDLDPDCFAEVLHQLRLLQLTFQSEVSWGKVPAPERRDVYFRAMLDFLGIAKLPNFSPLFSFMHSGMLTEQAESTVVSAAEGHKWAVGDSVMEAGTYMWGFRIQVLQNNYWAFLGVISSTRPADKSFFDSTSFGWACTSTSYSADCYIAGRCVTGYGGWSGFQEGDDVTMQLNVDSGVLRMKVARLQQTIFHFTGLPQGPWRVHVNLFNHGDRVKLLSASQF